MTGNPDRLYALLPEIYRLRDADRGFPLRALLRVIEEQAGILENDIAQMYENWFIETCEDWAVPYIGDLLGYLPLQNTGEPVDPASPRDLARSRVLIPRRDVANTIRYRRRKGTLALLELLANDVAGWPARAVEFYTLLGWTQNLNFRHPSRGRFVSLQDRRMLENIDGPFDTAAHTADIRRIRSRHTPGRYNIPAIGIFACRLKSYPVTRARAYRVDNVRPAGYLFSILGNDCPLFTCPLPEPSPTHIAREINLPVAIRPRVFSFGLHGDDSPYYGEGSSLAVYIGNWPRKGDDALVPQERVIAADLGSWKYRVPRDHVAIDTRLGRMRFPANQEPPGEVLVSYHYGFSDDIGGGEYPREIPGPDPEAISAIRAGEVKRPEILAGKLRADPAPDPLSAHIGTRLSGKTRGLLDSPGSEEFGAALAQDLNAVLADTDLCERIQCGKTEVLPDRVWNLCSLPPGTGGTKRRNRLILEAAYPECIPECFPVYRVGAGEVFAALGPAIKRWEEDRPANAAIEITDNGAYTEPVEIRLEKNQTLWFRAAEGKRPVIRLLDWSPSFRDAFCISGGSGSRVILDGLAIAGRGIRISGPDPGEDLPGPEEDLCEVAIRHCTLVPGWSVPAAHCIAGQRGPSVELRNTRARLIIRKSILGPILVVSDNIRAEPNRVDARDSILDGTGTELPVAGSSDGTIAHAVFSFVRCTILGSVMAREIGQAQDSIFAGRVTVARSQAGCMRFCYVPYGSRTPRRFSCIPDKLTAERIRREARPRFTSTRYGSPGYCQLATDCPGSIRCGAEDESEMGVFHDLYQPQREANLGLRLDEYTPGGMETKIFFVN
jgi:hypothetical protein